VVAGSYLAAWTFGVALLPDLLQPPLLSALPGPVFGFLIDSLQHLGKVTEETGLMISIVVLGAGAGGLVAAVSRRFGKFGAQAAQADPLRRRLVQLVPLAVGSAALTVVAARLLPEWYQAVRQFFEKFDYFISRLRNFSSFTLIPIGRRKLPEETWKLITNG